MQAKTENMKNSMTKKTMIITDKRNKNRQRTTKDKTGISVSSLQDRARKK